MNGYLRKVKGSLEDMWRRDRRCAVLASGSHREGREIYLGGEAWVRQIVSMS